MKRLTHFALACMLFTACAQPGKDSTTTPVPETPAQSDSTISYHAGLLSQAYANWKNELATVETTDVHAYELTEAYLLAFKTGSELSISKIDDLIWLLGKFKTIKDPAADSPEMKNLAAEFVKKGN